MTMWLLGKRKELASVANDFEKLLQDFSKSLNKLVPNMEQKKKITQAGAKVLEENLRKNTPVFKNLAI